MSDSYLKKEFKQSDVQRVRNIVNKDFTSRTKSQTGYQKAYQSYKEGDIWEESGKTWTIKNGIKQNITKLDKAKKAARIPLTCPKCKGSMKHHLAKKMYKIHGFCFDCTIEYEAELRKAGLYEQYEKRMMTGNVESFLKDIESWVLESLNDNITMVTEQGDVEDWSGMDNKYKDTVLSNLKGYTDFIRKQFS
jgi:hypothetical protein